MDTEPTSTVKIRPLSHSDVNQQITIEGSVTCTCSRDTVDRG